MKAFIVFAVLIGSALSANAGTICLGRELTEPDFGLSYSYVASCDSSQSYSKSTFALVGYVSASKKARVNGAVMQKLAAEGLLPIALLSKGEDGLTIFSDQSLDHDAAYCVALGNAVDSGSVICSQGVKLTSDVQQNLSLPKILQNNGFHQIAEIKNVENSVGQIETALVYAK